MHLRCKRRLAHGVRSSHDLEPTKAFDLEVRDVLWRYAIVAALAFVVGSATVVSAANIRQSAASEADSTGR